MHPNISEFSYGFAITNELITRPGAKVNAAPVFPSLFDEGQPGGGWDVRIDRPSLPLFLQFKLSHCMTRRNAKECKDGCLNPPFYRFHLRPSKYSNQHELLLELEMNGQEVYYSAPAFHLPDELNQKFLTRSVRDSSIWIRPSEIGTLPDDKAHHVAFSLPGERYFYSEPRHIGSGRSFSDLEETLLTHLRQKGLHTRNKEAWHRVAATVEETATKRRNAPDWHKESITGRRRDEARSEPPPPPQDPIQRIAYYSTLYLEASFYLVTEARREGAA